jgi:Fe-S cluster assembly scaffold protein SufB
MQQADTGTKMIHIGKNTKVQLSPKVYQQEEVITAIADKLKFKTC